MNQLKNCSISRDLNNQAHNLNIQMYSFQELLNLFNLTNNISAEDLKRAKKQVLMLHPDKSRLHSQYFLFYKKAFDIVVQFYETQNKVHQEVRQLKYEPIKTTELNKSTVQSITTNVNSMVKKGEFHEKFNQIFEENFVDKTKPNKNDWFSNNDPLYQYDEPVNSKNMNSKNMNNTFEKIKQQNQGMIVYKGVQSLNASSSTNIGNLYDDDQDDDQYFGSDPFSKLKFDDLRKVHKDQTVFAVGEKDIEKMPKYASVDEYNKTRGTTIAPLKEEEAEKLLKTQEKQWRERMLQKEYDAKKQSMLYEEKNKSVLSHFLQLK